jgi:hypothetical protein
MVSLCVGADSMNVRRNASTLRPDIRRQPILHRRTSQYLSLAKRDESIPVTTIQKAGYASTLTRPTALRAHSRRLSNRESFRISPKKPSVTAEASVLLRGRIPELNATGLTTEVSGRQTAQLADCPLDRIVRRHFGFG